MNSIKVSVYPVDSYHGVAVTAIGWWTQRVHPVFIHWTIGVCMEGDCVEYHLTGAGVTLNPMKSKPSRVWEFPCTVEDAVDVLDRIQDVIDRRVICSYQSMLGAYFRPTIPRVDTCTSFVVYCFLGQESSLGNHPLQFLEFLNELEEEYTECNLIQPTTSSYEKSLVPNVAHRTTTLYGYISHQVRRLVTALQKVAQTRLQRHRSTKECQGNHCPNRGLTLKN